MIECPGRDPRFGRPPVSCSLSQWHLFQCGELYALFNLGVSLALCGTTSRLPLRFSYPCGRCHPRSLCVNFLEQSPHRFPGSAFGVFSVCARLCIFTVFGTLWVFPPPVSDLAFSQARCEDSNNCDSLADQLLGHSCWRGVQPRPRYVKLSSSI